MINALLITYCIAIIFGGGHPAIFPVAYLLVIEPTAYSLVTLFAWFSLVGVIVATLWSRLEPDRRALFQFIASMSLYLSWFSFAYVASKGNEFWNMFGMHFIGSAPFQISFIVAALTLTRRIMRGARSEEGRAL